MKSYQIKHCKEKVGRIYYDKIEALKKKMYIEGKYLDEKSKIKLIRSGKVQLKAEKDIDYTGYEKDLMKYFDFSKYCWKEGYKPGYKELLNTLSDEKDNVIDTIILGGCTEAAAIIKTWEKTSLPK